MKVITSLNLPWLSFSSRPTNFVNLPLSPSEWVTLIIYVKDFLVVLIRKVSSWQHKFGILLINNGLLVLSDFIYFKLFECSMNQSIDCSFIYQLLTRNADPWAICKLILIFIYLWDLDVWFSFAKLIMAAIMSPLHVELVWLSIGFFLLYTISYLIK